MPYFYDYFSHILYGTFLPVFGALLGKVFL